MDKRILEAIEYRKKRTGKDTTVEVYKGPGGGKRYRVENLVVLHNVTKKDADPEEVASTIRTLE